MSQQVRHTRVLVVGAGFAGLGMALELTRRGERDFLILEKADAVGGTWRQNVYPGCACDIPSVLYSYSFAPKRDWS
ncbi:MAG: FAD-dependent oxidoreductase, partial [Nocardiaceae bacterium]|nr:FAD-dependent oxidoreductase [Nocardiaceae bacterium]